MKRLTTKELKEQIDSLVIAASLAVIYDNKDAFARANSKREALEKEFFSRRNYKDYEKIKCRCCGKVHYAKDRPKSNKDICFNCID